MKYESHTMKWNVTDLRDLLRKKRKAQVGEIGDPNSILKRKRSVSPSPEAQGTAETRKVVLYSEAFSEEETDRNLSPPSKKVVSLSDSRFLVVRKDAGSDFRITRTVPLIPANETSKLSSNKDLK